MKHLKQYLLILFALLLFFSCQGFSETSPAVARIYYVAGGYWPSIDGDFGESQRTEVTGEGYYSVSASFTDQGGWVAEGNGITELYLILENGNTDDSIMNELYLGIEEVRVNGTPVSLGNAAHGPCNYTNISEGVFTTTDSYTVLYYDYFADNNSPLPNNHVTWNGEEGDISPVNPDEFLNVVSIEIDFFVTAKQGEKPSQDPAIPVQLPAFTLPNETFLTLAETGVPMDKVIACIPDMETIVEDGKIRFRDIGAHRATFWNFSTPEMVDLTLNNGYWETEVTHTAEELAAIGYSMEQFFDTSSIIYNQNGWTQLLHHQYEPNSSMNILRSGKAEFTYGSSEVGLYTNTYSIENGELLDQQNFYDSCSAIYDNTGTLQQFSYTDDSFTTFLFTPQQGWHGLGSSGWVPCDPPESKKDITVPWIYQHYPHQIPGGLNGLPAVFDLPEFTLESKTYTNLSQSSLPLDDIVASVPALTMELEDGILKVQDLGADTVTFKCFSDMCFIDFEKNGAYWEAAIPYTAEELENADYRIDFEVGPHSLMYDLDGWFWGMLRTTSGDIHHTLAIYPIAREISIEYDITNGFVRDYYDMDSKALKQQELGLEPHMATYNENGRLKEFLYAFDDSVYWYTPEDGWVPPAEPEKAEILKEINTAWIYQHYPHRIPDGMVYHAMPEQWDILLPGDLKEVDDLAFSGTNAASVYIPQGVESMGAEVFKNCSGLRFIYIPASVTHLDETLFDGCDDLVIFTPENSAAMTFAKAHQIPYVLE